MPPPLSLTYMQRQGITLKAQYTSMSDLLSHYGYILAFHIVFLLKQRNKRHHCNCINWNNGYKRVRNHYASRYVEQMIFIEIGAFSAGLVADLPFTSSWWQTTCIWFEYNLPSNILQTLLTMHLLYCCFQC